MWRARRSAPNVTAWSKPPPVLSPMPCSTASGRSRRSASPFINRTPRSPPLSKTSASRSSASVMAEALIALGGNVGDVRDTLDRAIAAFCDGAAVRLLARSSDYRTPPVGVTDQPPFINCAIVAATELPPTALLARAQSVEVEFGRNRSKEQHWGPRTIDIDLIAYDDLAM